MGEWQRAVATGGRRDDAEPGVIKAFEAGGASVRKLVGKDLPDLAVGYLRETHLVEVKTNKAVLRKGQAEFARTWLGSPVVVARTPAQARKWLAVWRERRERGEPKNAMRDWDCGPCVHCVNGECDENLDVPEDGCPEFTPREESPLDTPASSLRQEGGR